MTALETPLFFVELPFLPHFQFRDAEKPGGVKVMIGGGDAA